MISVANSVLFVLFQRTINSEFFSVFFRILTLILIALGLLGFVVCVLVILRKYPFRRDDIAMGVFQCLAVLTGLFVLGWAYVVSR